MALSLSCPKKLSFVGCEISQVCSDSLFHVNRGCALLDVCGIGVLCRKKQCAREDEVSGGWSGLLGDNGLDVKVPLSPCLVL